MAAARTSARRLRIARVRELVLRGWTQTRIALEMECSQATVSRLVAAALVGELTTGDEGRRLRMRQQQYELLMSTLAEVLGGLTAAVAAGEWGQVSALARAHATIAAQLRALLGLDEPAAVGDQAPLKVIILDATDGAPDGVSGVGGCDPAVPV